MQEQIIEIVAWKKNKGMHIDSDQCRLCEKCVEGVMHLAPWFQMLAGNEYLNRHINALQVLMTTWAVEKRLLKKGQCWYKLEWEQRMVKENSKLKFCAKTLNIK